VDALTLPLPDGIDPLVALGLIGLSFLTSLLTACLGLGGGLLMVAAMASVVPPAALIPVHGVVQLGSNLGRAVLFRSHVRRGIVGWFVLGALIGVTLGAAVAVQLPRGLLLAAVGVFVLVSTWAPKVKAWPVPEKGFSFIGLVTAFITMFVGATGPFLAPFLSAERLGDRRTTLGTFAACMTLKHGLKVAAFAAVGFAYLPWLPLAAAMIVTGFLGTLAGRAIVVRVPEAAFRAGFKLLLTALAIRLLWQALSA